MRSAFKRIFCGISALLILGACSSSPSDTMNEESSSPLNMSTEKKEKEYERVVSDFINIVPNEINKKINNGDSFYLYTGRKTCPYCAMFAPKLNEAAKETHSDIFYLDLENSDAENLNDFLQKNDISLVPDLSFFDGQNNHNRLTDFNSETIKVDEIIDFLNK